MELVMTKWYVTLLISMLHVKFPLMMKNQKIWCYFYSSTVILVTAENEDHAHLIFPKPPSPHTLIASKLHTNGDNSSIETKKAKFILKEVHKEVEEDSTQLLNSILEKENISKTT